MITVKTLSNYNDRSRVAAREKKKVIQIDAQAYLKVDTHTHTERDKQGMKNEALCSVVIAINKQ